MSLAVGKLDGAVDTGLQDATGGSVGINVTAENETIVFVWRRDMACSHEGSIESCKHHAFEVDEDKS